jgi:hypothetical protein
MVDNSEGKRDDIQQDECNSGADSDRRIESRWKKETAWENGLEKSCRFDISGFPLSKGAKWDHTAIASPLIDNRRRHLYSGIDFSASGIAGPLGK